MGAPELDVEDRSDTGVVTGIASIRHALGIRPTLSFQGVDRVYPSVAGQQAIIALLRTMAGADRPTVAAPEAS
jgi:hypothetical protein